MCVCVCVSAYVHVHVCVCMHVSVYVHKHVCVCVCVCVSVYVNVHVCVCMCVREVCLVYWCLKRRHTMVSCAAVTRKMYCGLSSSCSRSECVFFQKPCTLRRTRKRAGDQLQQQPHLVRNI